MTAAIHVPRFRTKMSLHAHVKDAVTLNTLEDLDELHTSLGH